MSTTAPVKKHVSKKGQNIRVFVRCRPLNSIEKNAKSFSCVDCSSREVVVRERPLDKFTKTFSFDRVFGPESKQIDVYKSVAKNSVEEVLSGFNCTIFAYGQTGTGKTFTMEGDRTPDNTSWDDDPLAGIIPRCVNHLFDELRLQKLEFTMRVSFLELYNEEIFDLLSPRDDMSKLRLYEDATRKGSCIIQGLEEVLVRSKANVYEILEKGSKKRQTAATLMNAHSSRSHTVFTVTLHIKENTEDGDELLKTGKLHLVDLAGSENISRSGAVDKRAREAGNINQSLLTLGRVITALEEKTPHIPYRESKLTRLLQDALGGRTKTSIVATISPAAINLEETLSTLDYAHRAKNIQNKPEVNQKLNKKELIGEYSQEIERLRLDLMAMREKSGVYLANENYQDMLQTIESQAHEIAEKITMIRNLEEGIENKTNELSSCNSKLDMLSDELDKLKINLKETTEVLSCTQNLLHHTTVERDEQKHLVDAHSKTEIKLQNDVRALVEVADTTTDHVTKLHEKIERKKNAEKTNQEVGLEFLEAYNGEHSKLKDQIQKTFSHQKDATACMISRCCTTVTQCKAQVEEVNNHIDERHQVYKSLHRDLHSLFMKQVEDILSGMKSFTSCRVQESQEHNELVKKLESAFLTSLQKLDNWISTEGTVMSRMQKSLDEQHSKLEEELNDFTKQQEERMSSAENELLPLIDSVCSIASNDKTSLENLDKMVHSEVENLEGKFEELMSVVNSMRKIPGRIKMGTSDYKASKMPELDIVEENSGMMKRKVKALSSDQKNGCNTHKSNVTSIASDMHSVVKDFDAESEKNVRHLGESRCELESVGSRFFSETIVYLDELVKDTKTYRSNVEKMQEENSKINTEKVEQATTSVEEDKEKLLQRIEALKSSNEKDLTFLKESCSSLFDSIQTQTTTLNDELDSQKIQIMDLFSEKMVQDVPTGQTPARQEYKFSRLVAATSPHEVILKRLRATSVSSASKLPLPYDTDIEDENLSPSFESSRLSASDSSHLEEDANDSPLNRGSTTDLRIISNNSKNNKGVFAVPSVPISRENSMLSLSRSSSTSSIPDSKDKENVSGQRGSTKKRGLKQPTNYSSSIAEKTHGQESNTRSRRVLGMQN